MEKTIININIKSQKSYDIFLNDNFDDLSEAFNGLFDSSSKVCIISDSNVRNLYANEVAEALKNNFSVIDIIDFTFTEETKNLTLVNKCYDFLLSNQYGRNDLLIALGGGICSDLVGYVAATFKRGMKVAYIPTTLLSMVDASSGGKCGVNYDNFKNMIGVIRMPDIVYINIKTLASLPDNEYSNGISEALKSGLIKDAAFYEWMINNFCEINDRLDDYVFEIVNKCINIKKFYVENDPYEQDKRAILNFGHTIGHALEKYTNFTYKHGECVALGMVAAAYISYKRNYLSMDDYYEIRDMFVPFNLPISYENLNSDEILRYTKSDKKVINNTCKFILLKKIGKGIICTDVSDAEIIDAISEINFNPND